MLTAVYHKQNFENSAIGSLSQSVELRNWAPFWLLFPCTLMELLAASLHMGSSQKKSKIDCLKMLKSKVIFIVIFCRGSLMLVS